MPPKQQLKGAAKKAEKKRQDKVIEDKTFGLKNKNKSTTVKKYVQQVATNVKSGGGRAQTEEEKKLARKRAKEAKEAQEAELAALFNDALAAGPKKAGGAQAGKGSGDEPVALDTREKQVQETIVIEEGERTIEDMIEEQRAKLAAEGKQGTPVTEASLAAWKAARKARKMEEERKRVQAELKKKKAGKGLSVLSGRALFDYDATLFADDEDAADDAEMAQRDEHHSDDEDDEREQNGYEETKGSEEHGGEVGPGVAVQESLFADAGADDDLDDLDDDDDT